MISKWNDITRTTLSNHGSRARGTESLQERASLRLALQLAAACAMTMPNVILAQAEPPPASAIADATSDGAEDELDDMDDLDLLELDIPMVVTAARYAEPLQTVPFAMSVITAKQIRRSGASSVPDALRLVPGMDVAELSFGNAAVSPRGSHGFVSRQLLVLVDGRQIFDSFFGGTLWGSWPFQLEDIARIEVIRGPGGVTWGANAVNGVINIITKDPADQQGMVITSGGGSRGNFKQHVGVGTTEGKLRMRFSAEYEASDGFQKGGSILGNLSDDYKGGRMSLHGVYDLSDDETFTFSLGSAVVDGGFPSTPTAGFGQKRNSGHQASFVLLNWVRRLEGKEQYDVTAFVNDFFGSPGIKQIDYRYQQFGFQFSHTFEPDEQHTRIWGFDSRVDLLDTSNSDPFMLTKSFVSTAVVGLYMQDEWRFAPDWTLNLGGRVDYEFYGGFEPSARIALSHKISDRSFVYGAVSRAFQMAPPPLRFLNIPLLNGISVATGKRDLGTETLIAYELGWRSHATERLETNVNLFWHEYDGRTTLSPQLGPPGLVRFHLDNRGQASLYGVEFDTRYAASQRLTLMGSYTYQQMDWSATTPFSDSDAVSPPKHKFMVGARYDVADNLHLSGDLFYVDAVKAPDPSNPFMARSISAYTRVDLRLERDFPDKHASFTVGVRNLLDPHHSEGSTLFLNNAEVPRSVYAELRVEIPPPAGH